MKKLTFILITSLCLLGLTNGAKALDVKDTYETVFKGFEAEELVETLTMSRFPNMNNLISTNEKMYKQYVLTTETSSGFWGSSPVIKCGDTEIPAPIPPITRLIVMFVKIATPLVLIIMGMIDIVKAVAASDEKKIKEAQTSFVRRLIPAVAIFLVVTIMQLLIGILADNSSESDTITKCIDCMISDSSQCGQIIDGPSSSGGSSSGGSSSGGSQSGSSSNNNFITSSKEITFEYKYYKDGPMPYGLYTPSTAKTNSSTPLIIWLHGDGIYGGSAGDLKLSGLLSTLDKWTLDGFNAYILCPHLQSTYGKTYWAADQAQKDLYNLIDKIINDKKINRDKVILAGHSRGAIGALYTAYKKPDYYSALVILSGYNPGVDISRLKEIPTKGFVGNKSDTAYSYMTGDFSSTFGEPTKYTASHGEVPKLAFTADTNSDNKSDLIEWMLTQ